MLNAKKVLSLGAMFLILGAEFQAMAQNLECSMALATATTSGLMPMENDIKLNMAEIQTTGSFSLKKCSTTSVQNLSITFCAMEDDAAVGIYHAEFNIARQGSKDVSSAGNLLALPKHGGDLISLNSQSTLTEQFREKMEQAGLSYPEYHGGDSLRIDEAVITGVHKGALSADDVVAARIAVCKMKGQ